MTSRWSWLRSTYRLETTSPVQCTTSSQTFRHTVAATQNCSSIRHQLRPLSAPTHSFECYQPHPSSINSILSVPQPSTSGVANPTFRVPTPSIECPTPRVLPTPSCENQRRLLIDSSSHSHDTKPILRVPNTSSECLNPFFECCLPHPSSTSSAFWVPNSFHVQPTPSFEQRPVVWVPKPLRVWSFYSISNQLRPWVPKPRHPNAIPCPSVPTISIESSNPVLRVFHPSFAGSNPILRMPQRCPLSAPTTSFDCYPLAKKIRPSIVIPVIWLPQPCFSSATNTLL